MTFGVILFTLLGHGISLTPLIRTLGVQPDDQTDQELLLARRALTFAALARLEEIAMAEGMPQEVVADQRAHLEQRLGRLSVPADGEDGGDGERQAGAWAAARHLRQEVFGAERSALITLRNQGKIDDEVVRRLERDLDLEERHEEQHVS